MEVNILDAILKTKEEELAAIQLSGNYMQGPEMGFGQRIRAGHEFIAEFKRKSPSAGWINQDADVSQILKTYSAKIDGIIGFSVLTDEHYFGGSLQDLDEAIGATSYPILRKDFTIHESQIQEAKEHGAACVLLIAAALSKARVTDLVHEAEKLEIEVLFEIKDLEELQKMDSRIELLGVNNRDLRNFKTDYKKSIAFAPHLPQDCLWISESGLSEEHQFEELRAVGYKGFLVGQGFMEKFGNHED
jgi:indole-3-glycerol phosphate synthase